MSHYVPNCPHVYIPITPTIFAWFLNSPADRRPGSARKRAF